MPADLAEKTDRYERMLTDALAAVEPTAPPATPLGEAAAACTEMAGSYLDDGRHFQSEEDPVNALASFAYGHGWLDCGVRMGLFSVPEESAHLFTS